jgi:hypothetical protein
MTQKTLDLVFLAGVNGENSNAYAKIIGELLGVISEGSLSNGDTFTIEQLRKALYKAYQKQEKEIDKYLDIE